MDRLTSQKGSAAKEIIQNLWQRLNSPQAANTHDKY